MNLLSFKWYDNAKIGIFIHFGVYSVPGLNVINVLAALQGCSLAR
jgi:hypothetical protein